MVLKMLCSYNECKSAELIRLQSTVSTTKISYANMIGEVLALSKLDGEIDTVLNAIGSDSRIGNKYLNFGFGFVACFLEIIVPLLHMQRVLVFNIILDSH